MSDKLIANSMLTTAACVTAGHLLPSEAGGKGQVPSIRTLLGIGFTFFALTTLDDFAPQVAGPLAFAVAGTAFTIYGVPIITKLFGEEPKKENK